ncbi:MAG: SGNH/GDSL hydrolase family protein [bacterium]|jgi:lysophospholipase L1-like esterase|nr:SGNH/GDSL hydrolase family protein [bacterium]
MEWFKFPDKRFAVNGLAWFEEEKPSLRRLPRRLKKGFRQPVWDLAQIPAGGRIRFKTDSLHVGIKAKCPDNLVMNHITRIGQSGFDIYVDDMFMGSISPDEKGAVKAEWHIAENRAMREITINMPLYQTVKINYIGLDEATLIEPPAPFAVDKPIVFYGSSITQGGCASTPGTTYQSFISRWLNVDFINLGFSGNGMGELELARAINEIDASCIVLDYWANIKLGWEENLPVFTEELRRIHKTTPIVVVSPFYFCAENTGETISAKQRKAARAFVRTMNCLGDKNIYLFNALKGISADNAFGLVDGVHCNSLGFYFMAKAMTPCLRRILFTELSLRP